MIRRFLARRLAHGLARRMDDVRLATWWERFGADVRAERAGLADDISETRTEVDHE